MYEAAQHKTDAGHSRESAVFLTVALRGSSTGSAAESSRRDPIHPDSGSISQSARRHILTRGTGDENGGDICCDQKSAGKERLESRGSICFHDPPDAEYRTKFWTRRFQHADFSGCGGDKQFAAKPLTNTMANAADGGSKVRGEKQRERKSC